MASKEPTDWPSLATSTSKSEHPQQLALDLQLNTNAIPRHLDTSKGSRVLKPAIDHVKNLPISGPHLPFAATMSSSALFPDFDIGSVRGLCTSYITFPPMLIEMELEAYNSVKAEGQRVG
ncbi:uncharacterized protein BO88DRAFT_413612 [Aspergillus vadensis CBS 113365]|uniref:Uncharacterized protein n=1 Tax=Aspergillus vadensis (strain CBS 113365 / IMI 142717 / IBT 24658) TaxID=1448311 RepID=A0A319C5A1_ASPVC|nr:hypothetical protein BO88DRAFT_413612 [Aspergillus vadensis CBS 113365]PYH70608.1 hypothetical protein BO88DRAFT_413612 [Aspergillus vadensis CBS 113365]